MSYIYTHTNKLHISTHVSHVSSTRVGEWPRRMRLSGGCATNRACTASSASRWRSARAGCRPAAWRWCCYRWLRKLRLDTQKVGRYGKKWWETYGKQMGKYENFSCKKWWLMGIEEEWWFEQRNMGINCPRLLLPWLSPVASVSRDMEYQAVDVGETPSRDYPRRLRLEHRLRRNRWFIRI